MQKYTELASQLIHTKHSYILIMLTNKKENISKADVSVCGCAWRKKPEKLKKTTKLSAS